MKTREFLLGLFIVLLAHAWNAHAATLRGQLVCNNGTQAATGIAVTVYSPQMGRSVASFTGGDGMYYLNVPPGAYTVEIWYFRQSSAPSLYYQNFFIGEPMTDFPRQNIPVCFAQ